MGPYVLYFLYKSQETQENFWEPTFVRHPAAILETVRRQTLNDGTTMI